MTPNPAHVPSLVLCNSRLHKPSRKQPHAPYTPVRHSTRSCTPVRRSTHSCTGARLPAKQCTQFIYGFALDSTNRVPPPPARQTALGPNLGCHPHHLRKLPGCSTSLHVCLTRHAAPVPPVNPWRVARWQLPNTPPPPTPIPTPPPPHTLWPVVPGTPQLYCYCYCHGCVLCPCVLVGTGLVLVRGGGAWAPGPAALQLALGPRGGGM